MPTQFEADARSIRESVDLSALADAEVLITGATGLIGSSLISALCLGTDPRPKRIVAVSRSGQYPQSWTPPSIVEHAIGDLADPRFLDSLPRVDAVIHGAGYGQPGRFLEDPLSTLSINTTATISLIHKVRSGGKFLFMSTSELYSGLSNANCSELAIGTSNTDHPRSAYIEAKRAGEAAVYAARNRLGLDATSVRIALAYGPGVKHGDARVLNEFITRGLQSRKIELRDSGQAMRTYCYISDAVELILQALLNGTEGLYNVGGQSRTSIADLAKTIGRVLNIPVSAPEAEAGSPGAPDDVRIDLARILHLSGKQSFVPLEEGLARTIRWFQQLPAAS
jgi:UDP-glucuronate decarboxylase